MATAPVGRIIVERDGSVATVTLDAPPVNAFSLARYIEITEVFTELAVDDDLCCVILTAVGDRAFSAGLDLHEFLATPVDQDDERQRIGLAAFDAVGSCPVPLIGAINGAAFGAGMVFASLCDTRIAADTARFALPEINVGRCGGAAHAGRLISQGMVRRMFFTGEPIDAAEALRIGLVEAIVPSVELATAAAELAHRIAAKSPLGLRIGKQSLNAIEGLPVKEGYAIEQSFSAKLVQTRDSREALTAAVEKRAPRFEGR